MKPTEYKELERNYVKIWRAALKELLHWREDRIEEWIAKYAQGFNDPHSMVANENPEFYVVGAIVPND
jgi:hypothetical protein